MTYRERVAIEHPEAVSSIAPGGMQLCPSDYGYDNINFCYIKEFDGKELIEACNFCWGRQAPARNVKPRRKRT